MNDQIATVVGVVRNVKTDMIHRGNGSACRCNHSGAKRIPKLVPVAVSYYRTSLSAYFCKKCFPNGRGIVPEI